MTLTKTGREILTDLLRERAGRDGAFSEFRGRRQKLPHLVADRAFHKAWNALIHAGFIRGGLVSPYEVTSEGKRALRGKP